MVKGDISPTLPLDVSTLIMKAWSARWPPHLFSITFSSALTSPDDIESVPDLLLERALVGSSGNGLILSYLQHLLSSQVVSFNHVVQAILKYNDLNKPGSALTLLKFVWRNLESGFRSMNPETDSDTYVDTLMSLYGWLLHYIYSCCSRSILQTPGSSSQSIHQSASLSHPASTTGGLPTPSPSPAALQTTSSTSHLQSQSSSSSPAPSCQYAAILQTALGAALQIVKPPEHRILFKIQMNKSPGKMQTIQQYSTRLSTILQDPKFSAHEKSLLTLCQAISDFRSVSRELLNQSGKTYILTEPRMAISTLVLIEAIFRAPSTGQDFGDKITLIRCLQHLSEKEVVIQMLKSTIESLVSCPDKERLYLLAFFLIKVPSAVQTVYANKAEIHGEMEECIRELITWSALSLSDNSLSILKPSLFTSFLDRLTKLDLLSATASSTLSNTWKMSREQEVPSSADEGEEVETLEFRCTKLCDDVPLVTAALSVLSSQDNAAEPLAEIFGQVFAPSAALIAHRLDHFIVVAACLGQLGEFVTKLLQFHSYYAQHSGEEKFLNLADFSFLMLSHVGAKFGFEYVLSCDATPPTRLFSQWVIHRPLPVKCATLINSTDLGTTSSNEGIPPQYVLSQSQLDLLVTALLVSPSTITREMSIHKLCFQLPVAFVHLMEAWDYGVLEDAAVVAVVRGVKRAACSLLVPVAMELARLCSGGPSSLQDKVKVVTMEILSTDLSHGLDSAGLERNNGDSLPSKVVILSEALNGLLSGVCPTSPGPSPGPSTGPSPRGSESLCSGPAPDPLQGPTGSGKGEEEGEVGKLLEQTLRSLEERGAMSVETLYDLQGLIRRGGEQWFIHQLFARKLPFEEDASRFLSCAFSVMQVSLQSFTYRLLLDTLPDMLRGRVRPNLIIEPKSLAICQLTAWCTLATKQYGNSSALTTFHDYSPNVAQVYLYTKASPEESINSILRERLFPLFVDLYGSESRSHRVSLVNHFISMCVLATGSHRDDRRGGSSASEDLLKGIPLSLVIQLVPHYSTITQLLDAIYKSPPSSHSTTHSHISQSAGGGQHVVESSLERTILSALYLRATAESGPTSSVW